MPHTTSGTRPRQVEAAGAVVWRRVAHDREEVLLIHRPRYDDWSFPKGKLKPGEQAPAAAVREVREETGIEIRLGPPLPVVRYPIADGNEKVVRYWSAVPAGRDADVATGADPTFEPNDEVDRRAWFGVPEARRHLTHARDRSLLGTVTMAQTMPLLVVRHAQAVGRKEWEGPDLDRPLNDEGDGQAEHLAPTLAAYGVTRAVSSNARRCVDTLRPYASRRGLDIETDPALAEGVDPAVVREHTITYLDLVEPTALCTHRPTLPAVFEAVGVEPVFLQPSEVVAVHLAGRRPVAVEHLAAAPAEA